MSPLVPITLKINKNIAINLSAFLLYGKRGCPGGNQTEQTFLLKIVRKKRKYLQRYSCFLIFAKMIGQICTICCIPLVPCSLMN